MKDPKAPSSAPSSAPETAKESKETQEIMKRYKSRKQIYPDIKTKEDLEKKDYTGLVEPLEKNARELPEIETEFLKKVHEIEGAIGMEKKEARAYLTEIFKADNLDKVEGIMKNHPTKRIETITPEHRLKIRSLFEEYLKYQDRMRRQIELEDIINKEKETILTSPQEYARSAEKFIAEKIQGVRENWAGMDGKERFIAGAAMLVGLSMFLNSKNEGVSEIKDIFKKVGMLGIGYLAVNTGTKLFTGKTASEMTKSYLEDRSGKRNFLKDAFDTDKHGAEVLNSALVNMGPYDFVEVAEAYLRQENKYKTFPVRENQKELPLGGLAEDQMHPRDIYLAMKLFSKKLEKEGSSLEQLINAIKEEEKDLKKKNKPFTRPTFALILTAVLQKDILKHRITKEGKIELTNTETIEVPYDSDHRASARKWWVATGLPVDWKKQHYKPGSFPAEEFNESNAKHISSNVMDIKKPLSGVIEDKNFGRYTAGFKNLYNLRIKDRETDKIHLITDSVDNAVYISSRVPVDYESFKTQTRDYARLAAVKGAYDEAMKTITAEYGKDPAFKDLKGRLHEFVQPVYGVYLSETGKKEMGPIKEYVMFLRLVLPKNVEFDLRKAKEWPDGDMIKQMNEKPMQKGEKLTRAEFESLAQTLKTSVIKTKFPNLELTSSFISVYGGAYECFLTNLRINKSDTAKIEKVLDYFSEKYAGSGLTKVGLIRYLASHNFTAAEIKEAVGSQADIPNEGLDLRKLVDETTNTVDAEIENAIKKLEESPGITTTSPGALRIGLKPGHISPLPFVHIDLPTSSTVKPTERIAQLKEYKEGWNTIMRNGFDKYFIALCNGDDKALGNSVLSKSPDLMPLLAIFAFATNPKGKIDSGKEKLFKENLLPFYKTILIKAAENPKILNQVMEVVEEYRKPA